MSHVKTSNLNKQFRKLLHIGNESNCRWVFHNLQNNKLKSCIGSPSKNRPTTTYNQFLCDSEGKDVEYPVIGGINVFYSVNQYFDYNLNALLSQLHANYLDIDIRNKKTITSTQSKTILVEILNIINEKGFPKPNAIVASGSGGWHLYWAYEPIPSFKSTLIDWKNITHKLIDAIPPSTLYMVDSGASIDPGRVLRLPGTLHFESQNHCECIDIDKPYQFDSLLDQFGLTKYEYPLRKSVAKKSSLKRFSHNIRDWWSKIYFQLINYASTGQVSKKHHNRDEFLFLSYVALKHIHTDEQAAFDQVLELNHRFGLLPEAEVVSNLSTARRVDYRFQKKTIAIRMSTFFPQLDQSFLDSNVKSTLSAEELLKRQQAAALATNDKRKNKTLTRLQEALHILSNNEKKTSLKAISEISGISYTTVKKNKKFIEKQKGQLRSRSIYPPP